MSGLQSQYKLSGLPFLLRSAAVTAGLLCSPLVFSVELQGYAGIEARWFTELKQSQLSAAGELESYWKIGGGANSDASSITSKIFARVDSEDDERTHIDIRELSWLYYQDTWELRAGISKVFWGVTESAHRVDIINQTDSVESLDGEEKLGQPMVQWTGIYHWGSVSTFILPYFRERTFNGDEGYLGFGFPISSRHEYQSRQREKHIDWAIRYSHSLGIWDIGLSHFSGTSREPLLLTTLRQTPELEIEIQLTPFYRLINQTGIDIQATIEGWLWKLEAIHQSAEKNVVFDTDFSALTAGLEYTFIGLKGGAADLGVLAEYHYNSEGKDSFDLLQNDIFIGSRLTLNDIHDTNFLFGVIADLDYNGSYQAFVEGSRRLNDSWIVTLDARIADARGAANSPESDDKSDDLIIFANKDVVTLDISYYF